MAATLIAEPITQPGSLQLSLQWPTLHEPPISPLPKAAFKIAHTISSLLEDALQCKLAIAFRSKPRQQAHSVNSPIFAQILLLLLQVRPSKLCLKRVSINSPVFAQIVQLLVQVRPSKLGLKRCSLNWQCASSWPSQSCNTTSITE